MARLRVRVAPGERLEAVRDRLIAACQRFRESRLYVQTVCTAVLFGAAWLVHLLPYGPLARANGAVEWVVMQDYDFQSRAADLQRWARNRGGWGPAAAGLWHHGVGLVRDWVGPVGPFADQTAQTSGSGGSGTAGEPDGEGGGATGSYMGGESIPLPPLQPVEGSVLWEFGWLPQGVGEEFHEGLDFLASAGTPVVAIRDGTVVAIRQDRNLGTVVEVRHGEVMGIYAQVEAVAVRAGDEVRRGQVIAVVARSKGVEQNSPPHLHFEIRPVETGEPVDPASYLGLGGKKL